MRIIFLVILALSVIIPIGANSAFGEITTATVTFVDSHELTDSGGTPRYFLFNEDGTKLIIGEGATDFIEGYTLSTGYDLTTLSYAGDGQRFNSYKNDNSNKGDGQPRGMEFNDDGTILFIVGNAAESVPKWVVNLATWVSEDKITTGDMIIAIEHIINN